MDSLGSLSPVGEMQKRPGPFLPQHDMFHHVPLETLVWCWVNFHFGVFNAFLGLPD